MPLRYPGDHSSPINPLPEPSPPVKPLAQRPHKTRVAYFGHLPQTDSLAEFAAELPPIYGAGDLHAAALWLKVALEGRMPLVVAMGGHVIKTGCTKYLRALDGPNTVYVMNGAAAIHDAEIAMVGSTSEDVVAGLANGEYGTTPETWELWRTACSRPGKGLGHALQLALTYQRVQFPDHALLTTAQRLLVVPAIGTDTIYLDPALDGSYLGQLGLQDFHALCALLLETPALVWLHLGSAVLLPEVLLKAYAHARMHGKSPKLYTINIDRESHYRTRENVLNRPAQDSVELLGCHTIMIPLLVTLALQVKGLLPTTPG